MKNRILFVSLLGLSAIASLAGCNRNDVIDDSSSLAPKKLICDMLDQEVPYAIVIPKNANDTEVFASSELVYYFNEVTGQTLSVIYDDDFDLGPTSNYISIGNTSLWDKFENYRGEVDLSSEALNTDGFAFYTHNHCVLINAFNARGEYYGVIQFMQEILGIKFLNYRYTHIPKLDSVNLYAYEKTYVPMFPQRAYLNTSVFERDQQYTAHMRFNTDYCMLDDVYGGSTKWCSFDGNTSHTMTSIIPFYKYTTKSFDGDNPIIKDEYKEVFAHTGEGNDVKNVWHSKDYIDYCFTNGVNDDGTYDDSKEISTVNLTVEDLKRRILEDPECENYMIGQADTPAGCPCPKCAHAAEKYKGGGRMVRFVNVVAEQIKKWMKEEGINRDIKFCMFAYLYTIDAPIGEDGKPIDETVIPRDDVYVKWAPIGTAFYYSPDDPRQKLDKAYIDLQGWQKVTDRFHAWTYHCWYANSLWYYPTTQAFKDLMTLLKNSGVRYEFAQGPYYEYNLYQSDLDAYVFSQLCWDFDRNVTDLIDEYNYYYFGEDAALDIKEFHQELDDRYALIASSGYNMQAKNDMVKEEWFPYQTTKKLVDCFDKAIEKTMNDASMEAKQKDTYIENLERAELTPLWMRLYMFDRYAASEDERNELARRFVALGEKYDLKKYAEPYECTFASIKEQYGLS